jgi:hypothetical protein
MDAAPRSYWQRGNHDSHEHFNYRTDSFLPRAGAVSKRQLTALSQGLFSVVPPGQRSKELVTLGLETCATKVPRAALNTYPRPTARE